MKSKNNILALMMISGFVFAVSPAHAITIHTTGSSSLDGLNGNVRTFTNDGHSVDVSAESLLDGTEPWEPSYLGVYGSGLGVTNDNEGSGGNGTHTVDNYGSVDRVKFDFGAPVTLNSVYLSAFGDTDITVWYMNGGPWTFLEDNWGESYDREANVNAGNIAASKWAVGASISDTSPEDSFKIKKVAFTKAVPEYGSSLLLFAMAIGLMETARRKTSK